MEGLNVGADAYVTKPFEPAVLSALIQSQLKNRERVRKLLTNVTTTEDEGVDNALSEQDKRFMEELYKLMEEELSNSEIDVSRITKLLLISRTKLYYKIKGLTGETPGNTPCRRLLISAASVPKATSRWSLRNSLASPQQNIRVKGVCKRLSLQLKEKQSQSIQPADIFLNFASEDKLKTLCADYFL